MDNKKKVNRIEDISVFSDMTYSHRFMTIKYYENELKKISRQGRRTDLERKAFVDVKDNTRSKSRQKLKGNLQNEQENRQKLSEVFPPLPSRDRVARQLGISTATLSKYRRIIKLPDDLLQSIASLLDERRIPFEAAYIIASLRDADAEYLIAKIEKNPELRIDMEKLKNLPVKKMSSPA